MLDGTSCSSKKPIQDNFSYFTLIKIALKTTQLIIPDAVMSEHFCSVIHREIVTETSTVLFRSESKFRGFHANERPNTVVITDSIIE